MLDRATCEQALLKRDVAFDGHIFVAVRSTGIYCRPVCRVRMPLLRNVAFYPTAASAERAGYLPCLRCRPESAPFCPAWRGTRATVNRATRLIEAGALDGGTVAALADRLGITARHLARLCAEHLGASPRQIAQTVRMQRAKRLLNEKNSLSLADIAQQAGFSSARRLSAAYLALYGRPPALGAPIARTDHARNI